MKLLKKLVLILCLFTSSYSYATLTENDYITVDHQGTKLDWVWASDYNVQYIKEDGLLINELFAPEALGWRSADANEFAFFKSHIGYVDFESDDGNGYKNALSHFNYNISSIFTADTNDFFIGDISGQFRENTTFDEDRGQEPEEHWFDTFYVRNHSTTPDPISIPEPWTVLIFTTGLLFLKRKVNK